MWLFLVRDQITTGPVARWTMGPFPMGTFG